MANAGGPPADEPYNPETIPEPVDRQNEKTARIETLSPPKVKDATTEKFLNRYWQGVFKKDAILTLEKLSFEQAQAEDTIPAYEEYLS